MPQWLAYTVAFSAPFFAALAASWATTDHVSAIIVAMAAGFGGLAGIGTNQTVKANIEKRNG